MSKLTIDLEKRWTGGGRAFSLAVSIQTEAPTTVLFGPSGSGKTTLLRAVAGLLNPDRGRIALDGDVFFDSERGIALPPYRRRLGMVFQQPSLFPHLSALDNVRYAASGKKRRHIEDLLERFHVSHVARRRPHQLSGGEQQRVTIARALAAGPRLLLLDEPLSAVDAATRASVLKDLLAYQKRGGVPYLYVTHNRAEALALGGQALLLDGGRLVAQGEASGVFSSPTSSEAARVLGRENVLAGTMVAHHQSEGLSRVDMGGVFLSTPYTPLPLGSRVAAHIPSEDIILSADPVGRTSARNVLSSRVARVLDIHTAVEVVVDTPIPLRAHVSRAARDSLGLKPGVPVHLLIKAMAILVEPL
ncbi:MAG: molybdenum ABC transporter ATP-binding protein [Acidobacteriota bacterium]